MTTYASSTNVDVSKTRDDIERTIARFGATEFAYGWQRGMAVIGFVIRDRQVRFLLPLPDRNDDRFRLTPNTRRERTASAAADAHAQEVRALWRNLLIIIKAKLAAVEAGVVTFEQEFMAHMVLPDGSTVADQVLPRIEVAYETGDMRPLLGELPVRPQLEGRRVVE